MFVSDSLGAYASLTIVAWTSSASCPCRLIERHAYTAGLPPLQDCWCLASMLRVQRLSPCLQDPCHQLAWTLDSAIMQSHTALDAAAKQAAPAKKVSLSLGLPRGQQQGAARHQGALLT